MSVVQTTYPRIHETYVVGQNANPQNCDVDSLLNSGTGSIGFGLSLLKGSEDKTCELGAQWAILGTLDGAVSSSATSLVLNSAPPGGALPNGSFARLADEVVQIGDVSNSNQTYAIERAQNGTSAGSHSDGDDVRSFTQGIVVGISLMDERLPAMNNRLYLGGDTVSSLFRGDIAVRADGAVAAGEAVSASTRATTGADAEVQGGLSSRNPSRYHVTVAGARWETSATKGDIAVARLAGPEPVSA